MTVVGVALVVPPAASAHLRTGTVAVDYGVSITSRESATAPFSVGVYQSDRALHLSVRRGHTVVVLGYVGERFLRVDSAGVWVNTASPTAAATGLLSKGTPARGWRLERGRRVVVWHDGRVQQLRPTEQRARWRVPIVVDGRRSSIVGVVWRVPPPSLWPWLVLALLAPVCAFLLGFRRGQSRLQTLSVWLGFASVACALIAAAGLALSVYASPGTWIAAFDETAFGLACAAVVRWGPPAFRAAAGGGMGLLGLAVGLSRGAVFIHSIVLSVLPGPATRALIALAVGSGLAAAVTAVVYHAQFEESFARALPVD
ncbi:MAG TPA: hypothetical protein VFA97_11350 [Gaiellaceae bacterium]|nr:hypothetical protein [Gaiellaceae bacterium]